MNEQITTASAYAYGLECHYSQWPAERWQRAGGVDALYYTESAALEGVKVYDATTGTDWSFRVVAL
jgi:hypothetical protein